MKKVILSLALLAGMTGAAQAQTGVRFGLKGGINYTTLTAKNTDGIESKLGLQAGAFANLGLSDLISIQPEVLYSQKGFQSKDASKNKAKFNYIDIPVLVKVNAGGLFFEAGPQLGILASAKVTDGSTDVDIKENLNTVDFGYVAGLGYQLETGPMIGLRYNGGITDIAKDGNNDNKTRNSAFQLYVGYTFGGK